MRVFTQNALYNIKHIEICGGIVTSAVVFIIGTMRGREVSSYIKLKDTLGL